LSSDEQSGLSPEDRRSVDGKSDSKFATGDHEAH
jgi:hypothetical protein